ESELADLRARYVPRGISTGHPITLERARGSELWDVSGKRYIDFAGGIGVMNVGHAHPRVMKAVHEQLDRATHTSFQVVQYESYLRLAQRLCEVAPIKGDKKAIFFSTGAEAIENAVKIARAATGRPAVISFRGGFHGRTLLALSLTGSVQPYKQDFGPYAAEIYQTPFPYEYRGWNTDAAMADLENLLEAEVSPKRVAAIVIEPVQGEGGFVPAPLDFMRKLRELTKKHGILLIADEIQTGFGRTGRMFAVEHAGVEPDLMTVAKSVAGGVPLSAVIGKAEIMDAPGPGGLGGTYAGSPLACAAGLAVLEVIREEQLLNRALHIGHFMTSRLKGLQVRFPCLGEVRSLGAMVAVELVRNCSADSPDAELTRALVQAAARKGLIVLSCGIYANVIRFLAPLTIPDAMLKEGFHLFEQALEEVASTKLAASA
ncbi:MAG TPA: 4-aminobutyrate--2-oxoglutarate transaminase, partial [Steroidobacteraceae bacterium]|nr:4-aminobutyrate--2-oxoglutarate transaminase [Steroidobacteraceae bacterium]